MEMNIFYTVISSPEIFKNRITNNTLTLIQLQYTINISAVTQ